MRKASSAGSWMCSPSTRSRRNPSPTTPGIPVATVGVNGALNAAILAAEMLALGDAEIAAKVTNYKADLKKKITKANEELKQVQYKFKTN